MFCGFFIGKSFLKFTSKLRVIGHRNGEGKGGTGSQEESLATGMVKEEWERVGKRSHWRPEW